MDKRAKSSGDVLERLDQEFREGLSTDEREIVDLLWRRENDKDSAQKDGEYGGSSHTKIQKVLPILLQNQNIKKHLGPREIAVGPIYAKRFEKQLKTKLAEKFMNKWGKKKLSGSFDAIRNDIWCSMKSFFDERLRRDCDFWEYFKDTSSLFRDGCAVLEFIHSYVSNELEEVGISSTQAEFIQQDLFLFENQIPFKVLALLMDAMDMDTAHMEATMRPSYVFKVCIIQFVHENNIFTSNQVFRYHSTRYYSQTIEALDSIEPLHLLDLLHKVTIFGSIKDAEVGDRKCVLNVCEQPKKRHSSLANCFGETWSCFTDGHIEDLYLHNVQELKSSGITILKIGTGPRCLKAIDFNTYFFGIFGHLKLPALNVNDSTMRKLLNMVAYEMCQSSKERYYSVTSYLNFLDMLIDTEQDVKDLRTAHVLWRSQGSDAEVAQFFNSLGLSYLPKSGDDHFEKVHIKIEKHCARKCAMWLARMYISYLRNPWPTLGLFLAPLALLLTVVQTWFAINPRDKQEL